MFNKTKRQEEKMTVEKAADKYVEAILSTAYYREYALQRDKSSIAFNKSSPSLRV